MSQGPPRLGALATAALLIAVHWALSAQGLRIPWLGPFGAPVLAVGLVVALVRRGDLGLEVGPLGPDLVHVGRVLGACALVLLVLGSGAVVYVRLTGVEVPLQPLGVSALDQVGPYLLLVCVQAPLWEELVHRGWIQRELRDGLGSRGAILVSGLVFWVSHWWWAGQVTWPNQLVGGWVIAWSYECSRSLTTPILLHAAGNLALVALDVVVLARPGWLEALLGVGG